MLTGTARTGVEVLRAAPGVFAVLLHTFESCTIATIVYNASGHNPALRPAQREVECSHPVGPRSHTPVLPGRGGDRASAAPGCGIMEGVSTDTLVRPDTTTDETTADDTPKFFHYVKKNKIAESAVMGTMVVALCGEVFPVTRSAKPGSPVCPECKKVYESLRKGD
ncbi:hypothetical protein GCM10011588_06800 [Nocardia jinanensis]|uniref:DUF3039 domain-containing protein n=1 Tax=Nocardia jinanensis TaxID=382504 RepID=A0A917R8E9_9NOCA|nr:hypothetical protein GCM10011588_06800 [Nocardia jinanensis]